MKQLNIYIDRLKSGSSEPLQEELPPSFLEIDEADLRFSETVSLSGEAYLTDDHLVLRLTIKTSAIIPCLVCNTSVTVPILINDFYHTEPLEQLSAPFFNCAQPLREAILLQVPSFAECGGGACPERKDINKYLKHKESNSKEPPTYCPFADLDK